MGGANEAAGTRGVAPARGTSEAKPGTRAIQRAQGEERDASERAGGARPNEAEDRHAERGQKGAGPGERDEDKGQEDTGDRDGAEAAGRGNKGGGTNEAKPARKADGGRGTGGGRHPMRRGGQGGTNEAMGAGDSRAERPGRSTSQGGGRRSGTLEGARGRAMPSRAGPWGVG